MLAVYAGTSTIVLFKEHTCDKIDVFSCYKQFWLVDTDSNCVCTVGTMYLKTSSGEPMTIISEQYIKELWAMFKSSIQIHWNKQHAGQFFQIGIHFDSNSILIGRCTCKSSLQIICWTTWVSSSNSSQQNILFISWFNIRTFEIFISNIRASQQCC